MSMAARPSRPAPTTGAAVRTAKPCDVDEDWLPLLLPVPVALLPVWLAMELLARVVLLPFLEAASWLTKFAQATAAVKIVSRNPFHPAQSAARSSRQVWLLEP